ncbi:MAG: cytochrome c3 family protein [Desulfobacteraceae bacterium]
MKKLITVLTFFTISLFSVISIGYTNESNGYTGSGTCQACHEEVYKTWKSSKHAVEFKTDQEDLRACNICHSTGLSSANQTPLEKNVGCEACHGPGEKHVSSGGAPDKIVSVKSADVCGRCHNGNRSDDITGIRVYKPGMKLADIKGLNLIPVSPDKTPPFLKDVHPSLTYNMWLASGHAKMPDRDIEINDKKWEGPVVCAACHNPHYSENTAQLVMNPKELCKSCHFQGAVLKGFGAKGIEETRSLHTAAPCVSCHMTEKNHLMKMFRPDDPNLSEDRLDSCSDCHEIKDRKMRSRQLQDMEAWYNEAMEPVEKELKVIEEKLKKNPNILNAELKAKLDDVKANLSIIINDGSNGVHNLDYALEVMYLAKRYLKDIKKAID